MARQRRQLNVRFDEDVLERLGAHAERVGLNVSEVVRLAVMDALDSTVVETVERELSESVAKNQQYCERLLSGRIGGSDAVYLPELPEGDAITETFGRSLNDREIYIYHRAFNEGVAAALSTLRKAQEPQKNLVKELFGLESDTEA